MNATQTIVSALKLKPCTYRDMLLAGGHITSTSPHKQALEWLESAEGQKWQLRKGKLYMGPGKYLTTWRIVRRVAKSPGVR